jgi:hypothetical protein
MDTLSSEMKRILAAKEARRIRLAAESYPEKIRKVVRLQSMAAPILRARGRRVRVWSIEDPDNPRKSA